MLPVGRVDYVVLLVLVFWSYSRPSLRLHSHTACGCLARAPEPILVSAHSGDGHGYCRYLLGVILRSLSR